MHIALINRSKFQGDRSVNVAMTSILIFFWGEVTLRDLPGDLTLRGMGLKLSQYVRETCINRCGEDGFALRCRFFFTQYLRKTQDTSNPPTPFPQRW